MPSVSDATRVTKVLGAHPSPRWACWSLIGGAVNFSPTAKSRRLPAGSMPAIWPVSLVFMFGWLIGLKFNYTRAIYFLSIPIALGGASLILRLRPFLARAVAVSALIFAIGLSASVRG
ncbi:MAG: hypothetical protein IPK19_29095 [Chloroflexi bacterium]|nr:hypothetical protein [Chloroflexota bacterium]